ncbi:MAG: NAD(+) diphosphatase [Bacteroidales bacterium]|nr:NAD(+) diphosphatase [Bacteroidales bacterium]
MNFFAFKDRQMVLRADGKGLQKSDLDALQEYCTITDRFSEQASGIEVVGLDKDAVLPDGYQFVLIREQYAKNGFDNCFTLSRAKALLEWRRNTRYCGRCGSALKDSETFTARECPECGNLIFPRIEPCVIVTVRRGEEILLARHVQRNQNVFACIAGFMEAGETVEQAVAREVLEETGIKVKNIRYYGSQSWPFPAQLMLGFTAEYESGEIKVQEEEISEAKWFKAEECPATPPAGSIAYRLIHNE